MEAMHATVEIFQDETGEVAEAVVDDGIDLTRDAAPIMFVAVAVAVAIAVMPTAAFAATVSSMPAMTAMTAALAALAGMIEMARHAGRRGIDLPRVAAHEGPPSAELFEVALDTSPLRRRSARLAGFSM
jgi:hypothetical protein